ncbi:MAG: hypothetical protein JXR84_04295 [Anaerolineae bacterium]|nr:hypothetical protein [Anaerolineae bacterium]
MTPGDLANRLATLEPVELPAIEVALRLAEMVFSNAPGSVEERVMLLEEVEPALEALKEQGAMAEEVAQRCLKLRAVIARSAPVWF